MDSVALAELVGKLALTVQVLTAYPVVAPPPEVQLLPRVELNAIVCTSFCNAQGAYLPERGLLLADDLDPVGNVRDRAVLLHELVHVAQERVGAFPDLPACERYYRREAQAYGVEHAYLQRFGLSGATLAGPQRWLGAPCSEDDDGALATASARVTAVEGRLRPVDRGTGGRSPRGSSGESESSQAVRGLRQHLELLSRQRTAEQAEAAVGTGKQARGVDVIQRSM